MIYYEGMNYSLFRSATFWTIVLMFIVGGVQAVGSMMPAGIETAVMAVLGVVAAYFHLSVAKTAGATN